MSGLRNDSIGNCVLASWIVWFVSIHTWVTGTEEPTTRTFTSGNQGHNLALQFQKFVQIVSGQAEADLDKWELRDAGPIRAVF